MKSSWQSNVLIYLCLCFALLLSACGGGSSSAAPPSAPVPFAYLQDTASGPYPGVPAISPARLSHAQSSRHLRPHLARPRASASVNIATGARNAYLMDAAASTQSQLNSVSAAYNDISASSDGARLVFTANDSAGYSQIFVATAANFDNPTQLTSDDTLDHLNARFSPDGATITSTIDQNHSLSLSMIPAAGGTETVLNPPGLLECWSPSLTPDGTKLVFEGRVDDTVNAAIYRMNLDGTSLTQLTNPGGTYWDWRASLSPDGSKIVFAREVIDQASSTYTNNIYVVGIAGESATTSATQLTADGFSWDSIYTTNYILFVSSKDNQTNTANDNLYRMDTGGSNVVRLTSTTLQDAFDLSAI